MQAGAIAAHASYTAALHCPDSPGTSCFTAAKMDDALLRNAICLPSPALGAVVPGAFFSLVKRVADVRPRQCHCMTVAAGELFILCAYSCQF